MLCANCPERPSGRSPGRQAAHPATSRTARSSQLSIRSNAPTPSPPASTGRWLAARHGRRSRRAARAGRVASATRRLAARSFAGIEKTLDGKRSTEEERFIREQEKANKAKRDATVAEITTVGVVGLGLMGHGIAQISAAAGFQTVGVDLNSDVLANGQKAIEASVAKMNSRKASKNPDFDAPAATEETLARLSYASSVDAVAQCDLIVEAIVEDAAIKQTFYVATMITCNVWLTINKPT